MPKNRSLFVCCCLCFWNLVGVFADPDAVKPVSVTEGGSVTLESGLTEIQKEDPIMWRFGLAETRTLIACINKEDEIFNTSHGDVVGFRDRLKLDHQTGSLTIMNIRTTDSGLYQINIKASIETTHRFSVTVYAQLPVPVISNNSSQDPTSSSSQQNCSFVCSVVNVSHVTLSWYKGNSLLSSISVSECNRSLSLHLECLDDSYSCVLNNPISNQTQHLNTELCHTCPGVKAVTVPVPQSPSQSPSQSTPQSPSQSSSSHPPDSVSTDPNSALLISAAAAVAGSLLTVAAVGMIWFCRKHRKTDQEETVQTREEEITYADPIFYKKNVQKSEDEVVYAGVVTRR